MTSFSKNLKRLRLAKNFTQEQAAEALGVSAQSVSRWECGTTLPDVTMLPQIARLYCVTIDDLYRETSVAYDNYAQRLGSIHEATREPEDFLRADQEYRRMLKSGSFTTEDLRLYGILHQHMMNDCMERAIGLFDRVLEQGPQADPEAYWRTRRQKIYLLSQIGRSAENIAQARAAVEAKGDDPDEWICLITAYTLAGETAAAGDCFREAEKRFPETAILCYYGGSLQAEMGNYEEAFRCWDKTLELDPEFTDAMYAKCSCYEEMGDYEKACEQWNALADSLARRGYDSEQSYPRQQAKRCKEKL